MSKQILDIAIPFVTVAMMLVVGLDLSPADFERVRRRPATVAAGLIGPLLLLPPVALGLLVLFKPPPATQAGLLLIASCPVGGISNTYNYLARASTALSVTLTAISCLLTALTMPLLTRAFELALGRSFGFRVPLPGLMGQLVFLLALPVGAGMFIRRRFPAFAARYGRSLRNLALCSIALLIGFVVLSQWEEFLRHLASMLLVAAAMVGASMLAGFCVGAAIGSDRRDRFTLAVEFATRNVGIASLIAITVLGRVEFAVFAATYFVTEAPIVLAAVHLFRRSSAAEPERLAPA